MQDSNHWQYRIKSQRLLYPLVCRSIRAQKASPCFSNVHNSEVSKLPVNQHKAPARCMPKCSLEKLQDDRQWHNMIKCLLNPLIELSLRLLCHLLPSTFRTCTSRKLHGVSGSVCVCVIRSQLQVANASVASQMGMRMSKNWNWQKGSPGC